jgi:hypothetical protein
LLSDKPLTSRESSSLPAYGDEPKQNDRDADERMEGLFDRRETSVAACAGVCRKNCSVALILAAWPARSATGWKSLTPRNDR